MPLAILGRKVGMTQLFDEQGCAIPVTVIEAGPCPVVQRKTREKDGYEAIQIGFGHQKPSRVNKPLAGHFKKAGVKPSKYLREVRLDGEAVDYKPGQEIKVDIFNEGELVDVVGTSIGKGFSGVVKRWNFRRGPMAHGSMYHRRTGSLGATDPARVFKGRKLPGRLGHERVTVRNLKVVKVDPERNLLCVKGSVPGVKGGLLFIRKTANAPRR